MALSAKQKLFVDEYLIDFNATQAAKRAGYSEKTAYSMGQQLLKHIEIGPMIEKAKAAREKRTHVTQDRVVQELARIGFADIRKAVAWGSTPDDEGIYPLELVPSSQVDDDTAAAITEVSLTNGGVRLKMADKRAALETLLRHTSESAGDEDSPTLNINITSSEPVSDIRVTRSDS